MTDVADVSRALSEMDDAILELRAVRDTLATALYRVETSNEIAHWLVPPSHRPTCPLSGNPCTSWTCLVDVCAALEERAEATQSERDDDDAR